MKLSTKLLVTHLLVGIISLALASSVTWWVAHVYLDNVANEGTEALETASYDQLTGFRSIKKMEIQDFFQGCRNDIGMLVNKVRVLRKHSFAELETVRRAKQTDIEDYWEALSRGVTDLADRPVVREVLEHPSRTLKKDDALDPQDPGLVSAGESLKAFMNRERELIGVSDFYIISAETGRILFTCSESNDLGKHLSDSEHSGTHLAELWRSVISTGKATLVDYAVYSPADNEPCAFFGAPVTNDAGGIVGVLVARVVHSSITDLIRPLTVAQDGVETFLVGSDFRMRSDMQSALETHNVRASFAGSIFDNGSRTKAVQRALEGVSGTGLYPDCKGHYRMVSFGYIDLPGGVRWAVVSSQKVERALAPTFRCRKAEADKPGPTDFYETFIRDYGYYDLFLFTPDGYCFYSVRHEGDWRTNLMTGPHQSSQLGNAVKQAARTKKFAFADYKPYAPSNFEPAAFIVEPLVVDETITCIVGLQLPVDRINHMVHTGSSASLQRESYLVGEDGLRRSNSFLYPSRTIEQSFKENQIIKTEAVSSALAGQVGTKLTLNYEGTPVLSAYTPVDIYGVNWALVCEQSQSIALSARENMKQTAAMATAKMIQWSVGITILVTGVVILMALVVAKSISRPIVALTKQATSMDVEEGADHDLGGVIGVGGEIGVLAKQFVVMRQSIREQLTQIKENEENLRITLDSIGDAVIATDIDGKITRMNRLGEVLTGWAIEDAKGMPLTEVVTVMDVPSGRSGETPEQHRLDTGELLELKQNAIIVAKDGFERRVSHSAAPIRTESGELCGLVLVFRDITEEYKLQERLRQSQKLDAIGQLVGGIAHDLNNMIGGIGLASELLSQRVENDETALEYCTMITSATEHTENLTQKLLAFARKQPTTMGVVNLHSVIQDVVSILQNTIDKRIKISVHLEAVNSQVMGDATQLQAVFMNLGINASQAMPNGGTLEFHSEEIFLDKSYCEASQFDLTPGPYLKVEVLDSGCGISSENIGKIFDPFFTTKAPGSGTGLGLSSSIGTIQQHKGSITVYSEEGRGTTFHILLRSTSADKEEDRPKTEAISGEGVILLIDDEEIMRKSAKTFLEGWGYTVLEAVNGEDGLTMFNAHKGDIDVVILDMVMPKMNGRDCFFEMKKVDPDVTVILSSGFCRAGDIDDMRQAGLYSTIRKPFNSIELNYEVHAAFQSRQG